MPSRLVTKYPRHQISTRSTVPREPASDKANQLSDFKNFDHAPQHIRLRYIPRYWRSSARFSQQGLHTPLHLPRTLRRFPTLFQAASALHTPPSGVCNGFTRGIALHMSNTTLTRRSAETIHPAHQDLCYRLDGATLELRETSGMNRGLWCAGVDGWEFEWLSLLKVCTYSLMLTTSL